jgi:hypothetical protein
MITNKAAMGPAPVTIHLEHDRFRVNPDDILPLLGESAGISDPYTREIIEAMTGECSRLMEPRGGYVMAKAEDPRAMTGIKVRGTAFQTGRIICKQLKGAEIFAFFVGTAGPGPEELSRSLLREGRYLEGYVADLVASAIAESVAEQIHGHIAKEAAARGLKFTNRYSPGYCDWGVGDQQGLFSLFPPGFCGITLSASSLMSPIKSASGVVGIGKSVLYREYTCELCSMTHCAYRQTRKFNRRTG